MKHVIIGNGPAALHDIDAIGNDFATWTGMCGKRGQSVPVSSGQPTLRIQNLTIGGTAAASEEVRCAVSRTRRSHCGQPASQWAWKRTRSSPSSAPSAWISANSSQSS